MANLDILEAKNVEDPGTAAGREYGADGFWWTSPANLLGVESLQKNSEKR